MRIDAFTLQIIKDKHHNAFWNMIVLCNHPSNKSCFVNEGSTVSEIRRWKPTQIILIGHVTSIDKMQDMRESADRIFVNFSFRSTILYSSVLYQ